MRVQLCSDSLICGLPGLVIVKAEADVIDVRIVLHHLPEHMVGHPAGRGVAVVLPIFLVHGNIREQIDGRFKEIKAVALSAPVKRELRTAAVLIALVAALRIRPALVRMAGNAVLVVADKHGIVVLGGFVDHPLPHECVQHPAVNAALLQEVGIDTAYRVVFLRKYKFFCWLLLCCSALCWFFKARAAVQQKRHRLQIVQRIKSPHEINRVAADALVLMKPQITSDRNLGTSVFPFVLAAGAF